MAIIRDDEDRKAYEEFRRGQVELRAASRETWEEVLTKLGELGLTDDPELRGKLDVLRRGHLDALRRGIEMTDALASGVAAIEEVSGKMDLIFGPVEGGGDRGGE
jgi:hypothetical protein